MKRCNDGGLHILCGRLCNQKEVAFLMTRLGLVEGNILESLESRGDLALHDLMEILDWEPCAIAMAAGSLIRQGFIQSVEKGGDVTLKLIAIKKG